MRVKMSSSHASMNEEIDGVMTPENPRGTTTVSTPPAGDPQAASRTRPRDTCPERLH
jgi:hypothetical protein